MSTAVDVMAAVELLLDGLRVYFLISHGTSEGRLKGALSYRVGASRVMTRGAILAVLGLVLTILFLSSCELLQFTAMIWTAYCAREWCVGQMGADGRWARLDVRLGHVHNEDVRRCM